MASRLHESINSLGVLLPLAVSFFGFYYEHIRTSEAVDASVSVLNPKSGSNSKLESGTIRHYQGLSRLRARRLLSA
jgi:hypothetical protein